VIKWLWILVCYAEPVVVYHGELCWVSGCESWCAMRYHDSQLLDQYNTPWFATIGSAYLTMIHNHWISITHHDSHPLAHYHHSSSFTTTVLWWASGCVSWCLMLSQGMWIIVCYAEPIVVNHAVLCWASGWESWWVIVIKWWLSITHYGSQPLAQHKTPWFTTNGSS
jgi:hypothetical protein